MSNYKSLRIDTRGFERVNGRIPTNQEIRQEVINAFEKDKYSYPKDEIEYKNTLSEAMTMIDCYLRGNYVNITKEIK